jgi:hypothetical protein
MTEFSLDDVYRAVEKSRATIYTIIPRVPLIGLTEDEQIRRLTAEDEKVVATWSAAASSAKMRNLLRTRQEQRQKKLTREIWEARLDQELKVQNALVELSKLSGGWADFLETKAQAAETYNRIVKDLNQRYIIGYYPTNKDHDGKRRRISIRDHDTELHEVVGGGGVFLCAEVARGLEFRDFSSDCFDSSWIIGCADRQEFFIRGRVVVVLYHLLHRRISATTLVQDVHDDEADLITTPIEIELPVCRAKFIPGSVNSHPHLNIAMCFTVRAPMHKPRG